MTAPDPTDTEFDIPPDARIILPLRNFVAFPGTVFPLTVGRETSITAMARASKDDLEIGLVLQRSPKVDDPAGEDLHEIGCLAKILRYVEAPDGGHHVICRGTKRFRLGDFVEDAPFPVARVEPLSEPVVATARAETQFIKLRALAVELLHFLPDAPDGLAASVAEMHEPGFLADLAAAYSEISLDDRQEVLQTLDVEKRVELVSGLLAHRIDVLRVAKEIGARTRETLEDRQREIILREQMATIRRELGENNHGAGEEIATLSRAIAAAQMPAEIEEQARRELERYERLPRDGSEAATLRGWLDWMVELPWTLPPEPLVDLKAARAVLDADHFGLEKVKKRIVEYLAVRRLAPTGKAPVLCLIGPPGVGKTSLGQSIARALERPFVRLSLGGVHDEAEIRGHRRTYVGAMPGMILQQLKRAGARNCVLMLDEIDKLGYGTGGDPSSALLEVLDPAQNTRFRDNFLGVDFDLSHVVFLTTANTLDTIPAPLRDRMEIIQLSGYLEAEKLEIAKRYLVRQQLEATGLTATQARIEDAALIALIRGYTREAGVRELERKIAALLRHAAVRILDGSAKRVTIRARDLASVLGASRFENEVALRTSLPGVATGLAWTPVGGDILFIEASRVPGKGELVLTGQLGGVMRESAQAALTLLKARAAGLGLADDLFATSDIHIHVPAGATPKDGPSAGAAIFAALTSLVLHRKLRSDTAMTGEISLRGLVLPVGGIREKVVAAAAARIKRVLLPDRNRPDFEDIPEAARDVLEVVWLKTVDDVLAEALVSREPMVTPGAARDKPLKKGRKTAPSARKTKAKRAP